MGQTYTEKT